MAHPAAAINNMALLKKFNLPSLGIPSSIRAALLDPRGFASNLTATYARFGNRPHRDNDALDFVTWGAWYTTILGDVSLLFPPPVPFPHSARAHLSLSTLVLPADHL